MTHMSNYGNDRLGLYTFESVIKFVQCWTNIRITSAPPLQLAENYFKQFPGESDPVWGVCWVNAISTKPLIFNLFRILAMINDIKKFGPGPNHVIPFPSFWLSDLKKPGPRLYTVFSLSIQ